MFLRSASDLAILIEEFQGRCSDTVFNAGVTGSYDGVLCKTALRDLLTGKVGFRERAGLRTESLQIHTFSYINHLRSALGS